jgi:DNA-binding transcriptional LysR family regulator
MMAEQDFVVYRRPDGPGIFDLILKAFDAAGIAPRIADRVHRLVAAINLVAAGRGISLVPSSIQVLHREAIRYRPVARSALLLLPLYLLHRRQNSLKLIDHFISVTENCAAAR